MDFNNVMQSEEDLRCMKIGSHRAHQQAITVLDSEGGRVLTGSQDHTLKVYRYLFLTDVYYLHVNTQSSNHVTFTDWKTNYLCIPCMVIVDLLLVFLLIELAQ